MFSALEMGMNVIAFGLPILLTSLKREKGREGGKKHPRKEMGYRIFPEVNRIGRPNVVTSINSQVLFL